MHPTKLSLYLRRCTNLRTTTSNNNGSLLCFLHDTNISSSSSRGYTIISDPQGVAHAICTCGPPAAQISAAETDITGAAEGNVLDVVVLKTDELKPVNDVVEELEVNKNRR